MSNHRILNPAEHGQLRVLTRAAAELGDAVMACLTVPSEFQAGIMGQLVKRRGTITNT